MHWLWLKSLYVFPQHLVELSRWKNPHWYHNFMKISQFQNIMKKQKPLDLVFLLLNGFHSNRWLVKGFLAEKLFENICPVCWYTRLSPKSKNENLRFFMRFLVCLIACTIWWRLLQFWDFLSAHHREIIVFVQNVLKSDPAVMPFISNISARGRYFLFLFSQNT